MDAALAADRMTLGKRDAARSHIDTSVELTLSAKSWPSAHTLTWAALLVLKGIARDRVGLTQDGLWDWAAPGYEKQFHDAINAHYNFFKHADRDPSALIDEYYPAAVAWGLWIACLDYKRLYGTLTWPMFVFTFWFFCWRPEVTPNELIATVVQIRGGFDNPEGKPLSSAVHGALGLLMDGRSNPQRAREVLGSNWERAIEWDRL